MEELIAKFKETVDAILSDVNGRAEEVKENFAGFKDVFGKELEIQGENLKGYRARIETKGKKIFNTEEFVADVKEELEFAIVDVRSAVNRAFDSLKNRLEKAK